MISESQASHESLNAKILSAITEYLRLDHLHDSLRYHTEVTRPPNDTDKYPDVGYWTIDVISEGTVYTLTLHDNDYTRSLHIEDIALILGVRLKNAKMDNPEVDNGPAKRSVTRSVKPTKALCRDVSGCWYKHKCTGTCRSDLIEAVKGSLKN